MAVNFSGTENCLMATFLSRAPINPAKEAGDVAADLGDSARRGDQLKRHLDLL